MWGPKGGGPKGGGPKGGGPKGGVPKISLFFFPLPPQNSFFSSLSGCLLVECWWCFVKTGSLKCARLGSLVVVCRQKRLAKVGLAKVGLAKVGHDREYDRINGESTEFEWNIFPGFTTLQLCGKINDLLSYLGQTPETFTGRILFMSMFNDISCDRKDNKDECLANVRVVKVLARRFGVGQWSFIGPGSEKKWYSAEENSPQGTWDQIADEMLLEFAESGHPTFRATTPLSRCILKSKGHGKLSIHFTADELTIETVFRIIVSDDQLSI